MDQYPLVEEFLSYISNKGLTLDGATRILLASMNQQQLIEASNNCNLLLIHHRIKEEKSNVTTTLQPPKQRKIRRRIVVTKPYKSVPIPIQQFGPQNYVSKHIINRQERFGATPKEIFSSYLDTPLPQSKQRRKGNLTQQQKAKLDQELDEYMSQTKEDPYL